MLTDTRIKTAKPQPKLYKLTDERGLHLSVYPNGSKLWQLRYRIESKERTASLGRYPEVSLAEAREKRDQLRKLVANGIDPVQSQKVAKEAKKLAQAHSFEAVARTWFEGWKSARSLRHADYVIRRLEADVFPLIGSRPVSEIQAPELVKMMKAIQRRGAIEAYQGTPVTRLAIKLMALTFVRTGELIAARWDEFDLQAGQWRIPAERMKMRTEHIVPLSSQSIQILQILHGITGHSELLLPGERNHSKPMSNNTILKALERMGYKGRMTGHGFRGLASTILHEQGFDHAHIELQLAHQERNAVSAAYNHATYLKQRAKMMQSWASFLDQQLRGNVYTLQGRVKNDR
ncbi:MAG: tyrosine-type recombinase/integrase [Burkholderiales bacterium]|nr:tyrosine-type recombinase/integrase [Burkholderiales bacterium]